MSNEPDYLKGLTTEQVLVGVSSWLSTSVDWFRTEVEAARAKQDPASKHVTLTLRADQLTNFVEGLDVAVARLLDLINRERDQKLGTDWKV